MITASAEEEVIGIEEAEERHLQAITELDQLRDRAADHPLALRVLKCKEDGIIKAAEIARVLDVRVEQVYEATKALKNYLEKIRDGRPARPHAKDENEKP